MRKKQIREVIPNHTDGFTRLEVGAAPSANGSLPSKLVLVGSDATTIRVESCFHWNEFEAEFNPETLGFPSEAIAAGLAHAIGTLNDVKCGPLWHAEQESTRGFGTEAADLTVEEQKRKGEGDCAYDLVVAVIADPLVAPDRRHVRLSISHSSPANFDPRNMKPVLCE